MTMQPKNYCRNMVKNSLERLSTNTIYPMFRPLAKLALDFSSRAVKFALPDAGKLYDDPDYKALGDGVKLRLPYPVIALEYVRRNDWDFKPGDYRSSKAIIFACQNQDGVILMPVAWIDEFESWMHMPPIGITEDDYIDRGTRICGRAAIKIVLFDEYKHFKTPVDDYGDEVEVFMSFLNVLQCSNVQTETIAPVTGSKPVGKDPATALPFDTYHILTVDCPNRPTGNGEHLGGTHRSPREHLRRGHIRRLESGVRIWVNAAIVNAGKGGIVRKDYAFRKAS